MAINPLQAPINYMAMMPEVNIGQQFAELGQVLAQRRERQQAETLRQEYATDLQNAISNPTQSTWAQMIAKYPKQREAFGDAAKIYGQERLNNEFSLGAEVSTALENNRPDVALDRLKTALEGYKRSGISAGTFQQVADLIEARNVTGAQAATNFALSTLDPERFKKMVDANQTARESPYKLQEALAKAQKAVQDATNAVLTAEDDIAKAKAQALLEQAKADEAAANARVAQATEGTRIGKAASEAEVAAVNARFAEQLAKAGLDKTNWDIKNLQSQINDRAAKLNLDRQTTAATVAEKMASIQARLTDIPEGARKLINESATMAASSKQAATQYNDLAKRIENAQGGKGAFTSATEWFAKATGRQDEWTQIRNEYTRVRNSVGIKSLPPGPQTDKDIELALKGIPPENANAAALASFLRGTAKLQDIDAAINNAKTDWLSQNNGLLTRAKGTFIAGDYSVKAGETFNDFAQRIVGDVAKKYRSPEELAAERRTQSIGQIPTTTAPAQPAAPTPSPQSIMQQADAIIRGGR